MSGHTMCVQKDLLYFHLEKKNKTQVNGCFTPQRLIPYGGLFIAFLKQVFFVLFCLFFLFRNVMFCTCAMQFYRVLGEWGNYFSCFYLICKPTASALENAVNKVTLVYLAMLAKIDYLFTREILFVLLSIGCIATTLEWCLILCLWFSIENVKNSAISLMKISQVWEHSEILYCMSSC